MGICVVVEGPDRCGKSTQIKNIVGLIATDINKLPTMSIHAMNIKGLDAKETKSYYEKWTHSMFSMPIVLLENNFVFDRSHLGEYVYGPKYRNYDGSYVFNIEETYLSGRVSKWYLITFVDEPQNLVSREDGESFSSKLKDKKEEVKLFLSAHEKSNIPNKTIINIDGLDEYQVFLRVKRFLLTN